VNAKPADQPACCTRCWVTYGWCSATLICKATCWTTPSALHDIEDKDYVPIIRNPKAATADYIVVEMASQLLGKHWLQTVVDSANHGGIERVLV